MNIGLIQQLMQQQQQSAPTGGGSLSRFSPTLEADQLQTVLDKFKRGEMISPAEHRALIQGGYDNPLSRQIIQDHRASQEKEWNRSLMTAAIPLAGIGGGLLGGFGGGAAGATGAAGDVALAGGAGFDAMAGGAATSAAVPLGEATSMFGAGAAETLDASLAGAYSGNGAAAAAGGAAGTEVGFDPGGELHGTSNTGGYDPSMAGGGEVGSGYASSAPGTTDIWGDLSKLLDPGNLKMAKDGLGLAGGLMSLYQSGQTEDELRKLIEAGKAPPSYDYSQNWGLVNEFMNDPMGMLRKNPGYLASVDYLTNQEGRRSAGAGLTNSGNRVYNTANVLGNNAEKWYQDMWTPIKDAAGLARPDQSASLLQSQTNAIGQINKTKSDALGDVFKKGADFLPGAFKFALG